MYWMSTWKKKRKVGAEMSKTLKISNAYLRIDKDDEFTIVIPDGTRPVEYEFIAKRELLDLMEFEVEEVEE